MRGGAHVKEALGFVTLLWNHPVLTGLLLLVFTPPFFPLLVYFSPLLMSTALCVVALVSVGSQMEKIKAEGPGQLESHLGQDHGVSRWVPRENRSGSESMERHHYGHRENHRNLYSRSDININVVPAPPSWTGANSGHELATRARAQLRPEPVEDHPPTPPAEESDEDWWDNWVKEYESRPGWGEQEDQALRTAPAIRTSTTSQTVSQEPAPPTIPMHATVRQERHQDVPLTTPRKPTRQETREEKPSPAPVAAPVAAPVTAPIVHSVAASVTAPVSVAVVNRQEVLRSFPPLPTTSNSRTSAEEIVVAVKDSDLRPHISLAPIRTGREKRDVRQVDRIHGKPAAQASEIQEVAPARSVDVERVSDVQALQSIEKLLHIEMCRSNATTPPSSLSKNVVDVKNAGLGNSSGVNLQVSVAREAVSPQLNVTKGSESVVSTGKGIAVEASKKNRNKIAVGAVAPPPPPTPEAAVEDIAGETPLLRHLRTSRSEKQARGVAYSPLPARTSKGLMSEKVLPPPQFSPRLLQSLQPLPPRGFSPRLPNLSTVPLGNPVEKIPQWVYDGIPRERAETQDVKQAETAEEKHIRAFEKAISDLSEARRKKHARRPAPIQVDSATLQSRRDVSTPNRPSLTPVEATLARIRKERTPEQKSSRVSSHRSASRGSSPRRSSPAESVVAEILPTHILEDVAVGQGHGHESSSLDSAEMAPATVPTPRASAAFPSAMVAASPQKASIAATIRRASTAALPQPAPIAASPRPPSPQAASIAASPRPATPQPAPVAASPRPPSPQPASIAASPRPAAAASSPQKALVAASPRRASRASSPHKPSIVSGAPWPASNAASTQRASVASSPQRASVAASPRPPSRAPPVASSPHERSSVPSSPSMSSHPRRRRHSSKHCTDKVAFIRIEGSTYYDPPSAAEKEKLLAPEESAAAPSEEYVPIEEEVMTILPTVGVKDDEIAQSHCLTPRASEPTQPGSFPEEETAALRWGRSHSTTRKSRRRLEPRRVVTSEDTDIFSLKKSFSTRSGETKKFVDSSSDDERESVTPRASRRSMGRAIKPLVWRSRSVQAHEDSD
ncbi:hypothetical protein M758_1G131500 [Ceratodon purpureus]|uniref:Uncharacterized protein n=1 Tax=Ceratodon purpureus TaxID=3225 RepID=A0A8T0J4U0_CERPU|nr:hypothetical protein KC19_1G136700 [Ceratodon purpureus]KAG0629800.1 hypothetical protein M758_1G131500 [Ceratodon purpureus]